MTTRFSLSFRNSTGHYLSATLEQPIMPIKYYALFAHCFTCGKDIHIASRIASALAACGVAVMRFDFTGIGDSEGTFEQSHFSRNIDDLISAANFMRTSYRAPQLLIGHSLGGTAVLNAADKIPESKAIALIGAPATADHLLEHLDHAIGELQKHDYVNINIAGKSLTINRDFISDFQAQSVTDKIGQLRKALLIFHSPLDTVVSIDEATKIFMAAKHPKSFISLDKADHLLVNRADVEFVASTISAWATRYISSSQTSTESDIAKGEIVVGEGNKKFLREIASDDHFWLSDEPETVGGDNLGPDPYEQLLSSLGACTSMTMRMYANHKGWPVEDIQVQLKHTRIHDEDCDQPDKPSCKIELIEKAIHIKGQLDEKQISRLKEVADRCPVHKTLLGHIKITSHFEYDMK